MNIPPLVRLIVAAFLAALAPFAVAEKGTEYKLQKEDVIKMTVFQEPELALEAPIGKSGDVSFPLIGSVEVGGKTVKALEKELKALYEEDYLVNAQVSLSILKYAEKRVAVGGEVRRPGNFPLPEDGTLNLDAAIAQAGGFTEEANKYSIVVNRVDGSRKTVSYSKAGSMKLKHGDTIIVNRTAQNKRTVTVNGKVNRPGVVMFPKEGRLDIITAIALAGDFNSVANTKMVIVRRGGKLYEVSIRDINRGKRKMFYMQPGDIITVKESII